MEFENVFDFPGLAVGKWFAKYGQTVERKKGRSRRRRRRRRRTIRESDRQLRGSNGSEAKREKEIGFLKTRRSYSCTQKSQLPIATISKG